MLLYQSECQNVCFKCGSKDHHIRQCELHLNGKQQRSEKSGKWAENEINKIACPICKNHLLVEVKGNQPSLDCKCIQCESIFEIKSRCLSNFIIPDYIKIHGGNYDFFLENIKRNLHLIVILYKVDEKNDKKKIREILFFHNNLLQLAENNGKNKTNITGVKGSQKVSSNDLPIEKFSIIKMERKSLIIIPQRKEGKLLFTELSELNE
jgi:hypothetical protein